MRRLFVLAVAVCAITGSFVPKASAVAKSVTINEIDCHGNDWIELANATAQAVNISGWMLSDYQPNAAKSSHRYLFPAHSILGAKSYLTVQQSGVGALQLPFGIPCAGGQTVYLSKPSVGAIFTTVDKVLVPAIAPHLSYGRIPNGSGAFGFTKGSKGTSNISALPQLTSSTSLKCAKSKPCTFTLRGTNITSFDLVKPVAGASISPTGVLKTPASKSGTKKISVKLVGSYGSTVAVISIVTS